MTIPNGLPDQFINWKLTSDKRKIPCSLAGNPINAHDPNNWSDYETVTQSGLNIGFVITAVDPWFFLDLDKCFKDGKWTEEASNLYNSFPGAWGEVSQSGIGLHILGKCDKSKLLDRKNKFEGWMEFYTDKRFIAFGHQGWSRIGSANVDTDWTVHLKNIIPIKSNANVNTVNYSKITGEKFPLPGDSNSEYNDQENDEELIRKAKQSNNIASAFGEGVSFTDLWEKDGVTLAEKYPPNSSAHLFDHSSADLALMCHLAFWTGKNPKQMERLFRKSALFRDKFAERSDYRNRTIMKAIELCRETYQNKQLDNQPQSTYVTDRSVDACAKIFVARHGNIWKHNHNEGKDYYYNDKFWERSEKQQLLQNVREFVSTTIPTHKLAKHKPAFWEEVRKAITIDPQVAKLSSEFNNNPLLLNTPIGTYELMSGEMKSHSSSNLITQITGAVPQPYAGSRFERFVAEVCGQDSELATYLQMMFGAALSGMVNDHWFGIIFGPGRNGKSILIEIIMKALGSYAMQIPSACLMVYKNPQSKDVLAQLSGKRLVIASEVDSSAHFDEALLKQLTGDEFISARPLYKNTFSFPRTFKLIIAGNHRPQLRTDDSAMRSRMKICEFKQDFSGDRGDPNLKSTLTNELGAVLQWLIDGNRMIQKRGYLGMCSHVENQVDDYFQAQATVESWMREQIRNIPDDGRAIQKWPQGSFLYKNYKAWCEMNGIYPFNTARWSDALRRNGVNKSKSNGIRYIGVELLQQHNV